MSTATDNPGIGTIAAAADAEATIQIRPLRTSTFLFNISVDKLFRTPRDKVKLSRWYLGSTSRMAFLSRSNSHFAGWWLLIKNISSVLLCRWPRFFEQSARISLSMASSLNDPGGFDRFSVRTFWSILVRMKKNFLSIELIFSASFKSFSRNRVSVNMRKAWYLSICTWSQYVSTGKFGVPIPGKSQNLILGLTGWSYGVGSLLHSVTPTLAAFSSKSLRLKKKTNKTKKSKKTSAWNYLCNLSHCIALTYVKGVVA